MANKYTDAIERARKLNKEEAVTYTAPSSLLSAIRQNEEEAEQKSKYSDAISRMRFVQSEMKEAEKRAKKQATAYTSYPEIMRTQEEIQKSIKDTKKQAQDAKPENVSFYNRLVSGYEDELAERKYYDYQQKYGNLANSLDFAERSQYVPQIQNVETMGGALVDENGEWFSKPAEAYDRVLYEAINGNEKAQERIARMGKQLDPYGLLEMFDLKELHMDEDEKSVYNYLYATKGAEEAAEYVKTIQDELYRRQRTKAEEEAAAKATERPVLSSLETIVKSPLKIRSLIGQAAEYVLDGEINSNKPYNKYSYESAAMREAVSKTVEKNWGKVGSFAYDIGMSMGDMLVAAGLTGGTGWWATAILGAGAAADTTLDALDRGVSSGRALLLGAGAGVIEAVTEKVGFDKLFDNSVFKNWTKSGIAKYIYSNILSEAGEEAASEIANTIADALIAEDQSYWMKTISEYRDKGEGESVALLKTIGKKLGDVGLAALGGAISGGVLSGGAVGIKAADVAVQNAAGQANQQKTTYKVQEIMRKAQQESGGVEQTEEQKKYTVLPTALDLAKAEARERGDVFDIGYEKPYSKIANTVADEDLERMIEKAKTVTEKTGLRHGATKEMIRDALDIGNALGRDVEFFTQKSADGKTVKDGFYDPETGKIYVNVNSQKQVAKVISHELTHTLETTGSYSDLVKMAEESMERSGKTMESEVESIRKLYEEAGVNYASETDPNGENRIKAEVVAKFVEKNVLGSKKAVLEIARENPSLARRVRVWLNNVLAKLYRNQSASESMIETIKSVSEAYDEAVMSAEIKTVSEEKTQTNQSAENEPRTDEQVKEKIPVQKDSESAEGEEETERETKKASEEPEAEARQTEKTAGKASDTRTETNAEAEEYMRNAEELYETGEISEEEFATAQDIYDDWVETGRSPEWTSEGFEEGTIPRLARKAGEKIAGKNGVSWSVSETLDSDLDAVLNHTFKAENNEVYIGETSNFLTEVIGVDSMPVYMPAAKAYSAMVTREEYDSTRYYREQENYHGLGKEKLVEILNASEDPVAAFAATPDMDGNQRDNRIVLVTDVKIDGKNAVVIEEIDTTALKNGQRIKANKVITTYERGTIVDDIVKSYAEGRLLYFDRKRSQNLAGVRGSNPQAAIRDTDFTDSIAQFWWNVNGKKENVTNLQYSVEEVTSEEPATAIDALPSKAKLHLRKTETLIGKQFEKVLGLESESKEGFREFVEGAVRPITSEYLTSGTVTRGTVSEVFEKYYQSENGLPPELYDRAKIDARGAFEKVIEENWNSLHLVRRYAEGVNREKAQATAVEPIEREEAKKRFDALKSARKYERKVMRNNLLTDDDMMRVGELLRGEIKIESLNQGKNNVEGIRAVYEAKSQTREAEKAVDEYKRQVKARRYAEMDKILETMMDWKDKKAGIWYQRETLERNIQDIVPDKEVAKSILRDLITPVHKHEADAIRWKKELSERVKALDISNKVSKDGTVSEAYAVQFFGEASDNIKVLEANPNPKAKRDGFTLEEWRSALANMWSENPNIDQAKIQKAAEEFRKIYEEIFEKMNDVLVDNGYPPVSYRRGYFPHFTGEEETALARFGRLMGIKTEMTALPTTINGMTENFKPGKAWFGHAQERQGIYTTYDAVTGFEQYIKGAADVIFHTEDIQKFRALANRIRYNASDEGLQAKIQAIEANETMDDAEKEIQLSEIRQNGRYALSNFVAYLDEHTNKLANKKSRLDRNVESLFGRRIYVVMNNLEGRVAANMIAANLGSALTNYIPVNQAASQIGWGWMLKGLKATVDNVRQGDGFSESSTFLMNRRGYDPIVKTWIDKASDIAGKPMELIDSMASEMIVRAAYARNLAEGMTTTEALDQADLFAASVMGDRSKGAMPLIFESKNPLIKLVTQFQLEVNNEFSVILKDIPRRERKKWTDAVALVLLKYFLGAFLYNELYEMIVGRRAALDPVGTVKSAVEDIADGKKINDVATNTATDLIEQLPFIGGVLGGGRIPIQSALPDVGTIANAAFSSWDEKKKAKTIWKEASKPLVYILFPFGGGAIKKFVEGVDTITRGGKYSMDTEGNPVLQYPFYRDQGLGTVVEGARAIAFGTTATIPGQEWVNSGFQSMGAKQTAVYNSLVEEGVDEEAAYSIINEIADTKKEDEKTKAELQRQYLRESDMSGDARAVIYYGLLASDSEKNLMEMMDNMGANMGEVVDIVMAMKDAGSTTEKIELLEKANLIDEEKRIIYSDRVSDSRAEEIEMFADAGMDFDTFLKCHRKYNELYNNDEMGASEKATELARWIRQNQFNAEEKTVIEEAFKFYTMIPSKATQYDRFTEVGFDDETAFKLTEALSTLEPLEGADKVTNGQKYRAVIDTVASPQYQLDALSQVMSESVYKKAKAAYTYKIEPETYITYLEALSKYDADGNGTYSQVEVEAALDAMSGNLSFAEKMTIELTGGEAPGLLYLSDAQLAVLWQLSGTNWSPKNNPYSQELGEQVQAQLKK